MCARRQAHIRRAAGGWCQVGDALLPQQLPGRRQAGRHRLRHRQLHRQEGCGRCKFQCFHEGQRFPKVARRAVAEQHVVCSHRTLSAAPEQPKPACLGTQPWVMWPYLEDIPCLNLRTALKPTVPHCRRGLAVQGPQVANGAAAGRDLLHHLGPLHGRHAAHGAPFRRRGGICDLLSPFDRPPSDALLIQQPAATSADPCDKCRSVLVLGCRHRWGSSVAAISCAALSNSSLLIRRC